MNKKELIDPSPPNRIIKGRCPLCEHPANFIPVDSGRRKKFYCETCKAFVVHKDSVEHLIKQPKSIKETFSNKSKQLQNDTILLIIFNENTKEFTDRPEPESNWS